MFIMRVRVTKNKTCSRELRDASIYSIMRVIFMPLYDA